MYRDREKERCREVCTTCQKIEKTESGKGRERERVRVGEREIREVRDYFA